MAVRFIALLIPLAITLPQLQASRRAAPEPQQPAALMQRAAAAELSYESRRAAEAALSRAVAESPVHEPVRTHDVVATEPVFAAADPVVVAAVPAVLAVAPTPVRQAAPPKRAAPRLARAMSPVKLVSTAPAPGRLVTRAAKHGLADAGCRPNVHCAPVVVAKVTLVTRRPL